jgi:hypothetical protein
MRRILSQAAQAAVKKKGSHFHTVFQRFLPRLHYGGAIWVVAHRICAALWKILHDNVSYIEQGIESSPLLKRRCAQKLIRRLRQLGYQVTLLPKTQQIVAAPAG